MKSLATSGRTMSGRLEFGRADQASEVGDPEVQGLLVPVEDLGEFALVEADPGTDRGRVVEPPIRVAASGDAGVHRGERDETDRPHRDGSQGESEPERVHQLRGLGPRSWRRRHRAGARPAAIIAITATPTANGTAPRRRHEQGDGDCGRAETEFPTTAGHGCASGLLGAANSRTAVAPNGAMRKRPVRESMPDDANTSPIRPRPTAEPRPARSASRAVTAADDGPSERRAPDSLAEDVDASRAIGHLSASSIGRRTPPSRREASPRSGRALPHTALSRSGVQFLDMAALSIGGRNGSDHI